MAFGNSLLNAERGPYIFLKCITVWDLADLPSCHQKKPNRSSSILWSWVTVRHMTRAFGTVCCWSFGPVYEGWSKKISWKERSNLCFRTDFCWDCCCGGWWRFVRCVCWDLMETKLYSEQRSIIFMMASFVGKMILDLALTHWLEICVSVSVSLW